MKTSDISVIVATYGDSEWMDKAEKAAHSAYEQSLQPANIHMVHASDLATARNLGAKKAETEWLCFLDADDLLDSKYLESMQESIDSIDGKDYLIQPSTMMKKDGNILKFPHLIPARNIYDGNWMVIGTLVRKDSFLEVGGFSDQWPIYEDWDLWIRCVRGGSKYITQEKAIYIVNVNEGSRNNQDPKYQKHYYDLIRKQYVF